MTIELQSYAISTPKPNWWRSQHESCRFWLTFFSGNPHITPSLAFHVLQTSILPLIVALTFDQGVNQLSVNQQFARASLGTSCLLGAKHYIWLKDDREMCKNGVCRQCIVYRVVKYCGGFKGTGSLGTLSISSLSATRLRVIFDSLCLTIICGHSSMLVQNQNAANSWTPPR